MLAYTLKNASARSKNNSDEKASTADNYIELFTSWKRFKNVFEEPSSTATTCNFFIAWFLPYSFQSPLQSSSTNYSFFFVCFHSSSSPFVRFQLNIYPLLSILFINQNIFFVFIMCQASSLFQHERSMNLSYSFFPGKYPFNEKTLIVLFTNTYNRA